MHQAKESASSGTDASAEAQRRVGLMLAAQTDLVELLTSGSEPTEVLAAVSRSVQQLSPGTRCLFEVHPSPPDGSRTVVSSAGRIDPAQVPETDGRTQVTAITAPAGEELGHLILVRPDGAETTLSVDQLATWASRLAAMAMIRFVEHQRTRASVSLLEATLDSTVDGILVVDASGRIAGHNETFARMWHIDPELLSSKDDARVIASVLEQLADPAGFLDQVHRLYSHPEETSFDELAFLDGRIFERYSQPQRVDGRTVGRVWSFRDVTDKRRLAEDLERQTRRLESVLNSAGEGICGLDADGRITFVNRAGAQLLSATPASLTGQEVDVVVQIEGEHVGRLVAGQDAGASAGHAAAPRTISGQHRRPDGSTFDCEVVTAPLVEGGTVVGSVMVFRDISERRAIDRMKDEFISMVSHEMRTPLTSIRGSLGLLASGVTGELPPRSAQMVDVAMTSADRLIRLLNDILNVERLSSGQLSLERTTVEAATLVRSAVKETAGLAASRGVRVRTEAVPGTVRADPDRIVQVLTNLLGNAIKFSPDGATVAVGSVDLGDAVRFDVRDEGPGIPADQLESIFERFRQADTSDSRLKGGTGLGLAISKALVEEHGGRIWGANHEARGATFSFTLPHGEGQEDAAQAGPAAESER